MRAAVAPLGDQLHERVANRLIADYAERGEFLEREQADRDIEECLMFLAQDETLCPTGAADRAWHVLLLYSWHYYAYCIRTFGVVLHHEPDDLGKCSVKCKVIACRRPPAPDG